MTKKADQLGSGRFGSSARPVSARRAAVAAATGVPTDGVAPPTELPTHRISLNPDNPRSTLGDLTDLAGSLRTHGQKQAITVMNRDTYIKANPDHETDLEPDTHYVVIDGSSRLAAAREAGLAAIKVMVSDDQGSTSEELLESALVANIHRQDLDELDEAKALHRLLAIHGSQTALAKRLHRSQGWVSQRLALLNLTPELQSRIGQEPIDLLRAVGNKPAEQQETALEELKAERARKEAERPAQRPGRRPTAAPEPPVYDDVMEEAPSGDPTPEEPPTAHPALAPPEPERPTSERPTSDRPAPHQPVLEHAEEQNPEAKQAEAEQAEAEQRAAMVPEPRTDSTTLPKLPYDDGAFLALHLIRKMTDTEFDKMLRILNEHQVQRASADQGSQS
ncbi:ParB/RepB/Spo0J family partition protein [Streptomyces sp. NPDC004542]|uniref:ParB/RepB/Spo0J family partition protein n=1 Tax=Streptomyces sp. NPDC004542 TaxID=3154281 RepID=UPI0033A6D71D